MVEHRGCTVQSDSCLDLALMGYLLEGLPDIQQDTGWRPILIKMKVGHHRNPLGARLLLPRRSVARAP
eukprot:7844654-Pyramimonas_sp.AAC.1